MGASLQEMSVVNHVQRDKDFSPTSLLFATHNANKLAEYARILGLEVDGINLKMPEIQGTSLEVLEAKAREAWRLNKGKPIIVEDTSLSIAALDGMPGPYASQFTDNINLRQKLCAMLKKGEDRSVVFQVGFAVFDGIEVHFRIGKITGKLAQKPVGGNGFGFDDIFVPDGKRKTFAQMTDQEKDKYSPRRIALEEMLEKPFDLGTPVFELPEPYEMQLKAIRKKKLDHPTALAYAFALQAIAGSEPNNELEARIKKPIQEITYADGQISRFVTDPDSASVGLMVTPIDRTLDLRGNPTRLNVDEFGNLIFAQMGPKAIEMALAARAGEFLTFHNEEMYAHIRAMRAGKEKTPERSNHRSEVIENLIELERTKTGDTDEEEISVHGTVTTREIGYARMSSDKLLSRSTAANKGLMLDTTGLPSSLYALGGMPPTTGWRDVILTASMSYMRSWIPRNSVFVNPEKQFQLFHEVVNEIKKLNLPEDIEQVVIDQIGLCVGCEDPKAIAELAKRFRNEGGSSVRIYTTNPDPRTIQTAEAIRQAVPDITLCVAPVVDIDQCRKLIGNNIKANILYGGHGGGENCTSLAGGGAANGLEIAYLMSLDPAFNKTAIGLEGGTGNTIGAFLGILDVISLNRRGVAGGIEAGGFFVQHKNGKVAQTYPGSASPVIQWIEAVLDPTIANKRLDDAGRLKQVEGEPGYMYGSRSVHSIVDLFFRERMLAGRALADQRSSSISEWRNYVAEHGFENHRSVSTDAVMTAGAHQGA